jgi:hypothetical protein
MTGLANPAMSRTLNVSVCFTEASRAVIVTGIPFVSWPATGQVVGCQVTTLV